MNEPSHIIVAGASAGGFKAVSAMLAAMQDLPMPEAAIFIVIHVAKNASANVVSSMFQRSTKLNCVVADDGLPIEAGNIYIAPPDYHMIIKPGMVRLVKSAPENRWRPSIDVLFRSAAVAYQSKVIGIILSGLLDDGTSGMVAIKRCGGTCIVQEPEEAEYQDMPSNALQKVDVDYRVPVADIRYILEDLFTKPAGASLDVPEDILIEANMTENMTSKIQDLERIGTHSNYTCPECGGGLWSIDTDPVKRYRCFTGHAFTEGVLLDHQSEKVEESLWASIRMMEERRDLLHKNASNYHLLGNSEMAKSKQDEALAMDQHIAQLKALIKSLNP